MINPDECESMETYLITLYVKGDNSELSVFQMKLKKL